MTAERDIKRRLAFRGFDLRPLLSNELRGFYGGQCLDLRERSLQCRRLVAPACSTTHEAALGCSAGRAVDPLAEPLVLGELLSRELARCRTYAFRFAFSIDHSRLLVGSFLRAISLQIRPDRRVGR